MKKIPYRYGETGNINGNTDPGSVNNSYIYPVPAITVDTATDNTEKRKYMYSNVYMYE